MQSTPDAPSWRGLFALLSCAALAGFSSAVSAQGWIAGGGIGVASQEEYVIAGSVYSYDDSDSAYRVFGAFMVSPNMGVVASYVDLGKTHYEGPQSSFSDDLEVSGIDMSYIIGWAPGSQERLSIFGTVGLFIWDQMVAYEDGSGLIDYSDDGSSFSFGIGADISLGSSSSHGWGIHVAYQLFKNVGDADNSGLESDRDMLTAGISYRFGQRLFER